MNMSHLPQRQKLSGSCSDSALSAHSHQHAHPNAKPVVHYVEAAFRHWKSMAFVMLCTMVFAWLTLLLFPRSYESEAKLVLRVGRESVSLDPTATTGQTLMLQKTQEEEIRSATELLNSRGLVERVVVDLGPENILNGSLPSAEGAEASPIEKAGDWLKGRLAEAVDLCLTTSGVRDPLSDRELAIRQLQDVMDISAARKSNVISVHMESKTPEMAQAIVSKFVDIFTAEHIKMSQTDGSLNFFETQVNSAIAEVAEVIEARRDFMESNNIVSIDANRAILQEQVAAIERDLIVARGNLGQAEAEIEDLLKRSDDAPIEIVATKDNRVDATWSGMRQKVYDLEVEEQSLNAKYTASHPLMIATREQLKGAQAILAKLSSERVDESTTPNPVRRRIQEDLQKLETSVIGLRSLIKEKESQHKEVMGDVSDLLMFEQKLTTIDREIGQRETSLRILQEKLEEARVIHALQTQKISNIGIAQPATFVERPISPKKKLLAAGVGMLGMCLCVTFALGREFLDDVLKSGGRPESQLQIKIVANIPRVRGGNIAVIERLLDDLDPVVSELLFNKSALGIRSGEAITVGIIGCEPNCGASTIATALAVAGAKGRSLRTLLIDANDSLRSITRSFGSQGEPTMAECIANGGKASECVKRITSLAIEFVTVADDHESHIDAHLARPGTSAMFKQLSSTKDMLVVDLPPASQPDRLLTLARHLDCVIIVAQADRSTATSARNLLNALSSNNVQIAGVVMNKSRDPLPSSIRRRLPS